LVVDTEMNRRRLGAGSLTLAFAFVLVALLAFPVTAGAHGRKPGGPGGGNSPGSGEGGGGNLSLTATEIGSTYAPTFTGNGLLGVRVPPAGQGYAPGTVPALSELAGFYAQPPEEVQQRANIPTWSTLTFADGGQAFDPQGSGTSGWKQTLDMSTGTVTTSATWTAPDGHVTDLAYEVLTDRARPHVGLVRLRLTPHWSGAAIVEDEFDGTAANVNAGNEPAELTTEVGKGWEAADAGQWLTVGAVGTGIEATLADRLVASGNVGALAPQPIDQGKAESVGQRLEFPVTAGQTYTLTKFVAVQDSQEGANAADAAREGAAAAAGAGWEALTAENAAAWAKLWDGSIEVRGNQTLAEDVDASQFYLWSSTNEGIDWSVSPAGLSSNGYNGHIFWDAETWMFPALLAQHPELAEGMNDYRFDRLAAARAHAVETGWAGARFPWESALDGTEQIPPPVSVNSEGLYEQHITADIALAQWQYYLATGDREWLATRGWPVISGAAEFWASRATQGSDGAWHLNEVTGPDEENPDVNDEAYTNVAAKTVLEDATQAAAILGQPAPPQWSQIAAGLVVPFDAAQNIHPEFAGYGGQLVKQADVTLIQYPWEYPMSPSTALSDLNYYVPRSDPEGPSMTDAVSQIDTAALGVPGCSSYVYTERSYEPFIKDPFDQFSETRKGGAFTFMTGIGGFLQEFLYGYSGLRWEAEAVRLDPSLTAQIGGVVLHGLRWHGRVFDVAIGGRRTTITVDSGAPLPVRYGASGVRTVSAGGSLAVPTRRPDLLPSREDPLRCAAAEASSASPGAPALAAVDGSPATDWEAESLPASLTVPLHGARRIDRATVRWGQSWPGAPEPNVPPPPGPVVTRRATDYVLLGSRDGKHWKRLATVEGRTEGTVDELRFRPTAVRFLRLEVTAATEGLPGKEEPAKEEPPLLEELSASGK
jgi:trehalose/maltose hydrolase-like predicted phosphorylase